MTTKKKSTGADEPAEFDWVSLAQPTPDVPDSWEVKETAESDKGPWWVRDSNGAQFATYVLLKGMTPLDDSPFDRSGNLRTPISGSTDTAPAA